MKRLALLLATCVLPLCSCSSAVQSEGPIGTVNPGGGNVATSTNTATSTSTAPTTLVTLILDGSVVSPMGGDAVPSVTNNCGSQSVDLTRRPPEVMLVLDQSSSMGSSENPAAVWSFARPAVLEIVQSTEKDLNWGLLLYPLPTLGECTAASMPSATNVDVALGMKNYSAIAGKVPVRAEGDGTPTDTAIREATKHLLARNTPNPKYLVLTTDGSPSCSGASKNSGGAKTSAVAAVTEAFQKGIPTFVIGASQPGRSSSLTTLSALADAGGVAKPHSTCPPGGSDQCTTPEFFSFYPATDKAELLAAFQTIVGSLNTCQIQLTNVPPNPQQVAVAITDANGKNTAIYQGKGSNPDGDWSYTDSTNTAIQVNGAACKTIAAGAGGKVQIWYGCTFPPIL